MKSCRGHFVPPREGALGSRLLRSHRFRGGLFMFRPQGAGRSNAKAIQQQSNLTSAGRLRGRRFDEVNLGELKTQKISREALLRVQGFPAFPAHLRSV